MAADSPVVKKPRMPRKKVAVQPEPVAEEIVEAEPVKKPTRPKGKPIKSLLKELSRVAIDDVQPHPLNPRQGDIEIIEESLEENELYKPIVVQKSTGHIIVGNHTWKAAKHLKWGEIDVVYVDIDDERAKRIMLADNRTSDRGGYNAQLLAEILDSLPRPGTGTGYSNAAVSAILEGARNRSVELVSEVLYAPPPVVLAPLPADEPTPTFDQRIEDLKSTNEHILGHGSTPSAILEAAGWTADNFTTLSEEDRKLAELQVMVEGRVASVPEIVHGESYWGIPMLRPDMLVESIPEKIDTWAGKDATPDDGETTWVYNWGLASQTGLPWDRTILSFFTYDDRFDGWFQEAEFYIAKVLAFGLKQAIVPDTSFWLNEPRLNHLMAMYNSHFIGRFLQEVGIRVIPRIMFCDAESVKYSTIGIPKNAPVVASCIQAIDQKEIEAMNAPSLFRAWVEEMKPQSLLVYGATMARNLIEEARLPKSLHVVHIDNYAAKRRGVVFDKKEGKAGMKRPKKDAKTVPDEAASSLAEMGD